MHVVLATTDETREKCHALYHTQCPLIYKNEVVLNRCFSISLKNKGFPFLVYLTDSYLRDKGMYRYEKNQDLGTLQWTKISTYFKKIAKTQNNIVAVLLSAIDTYFRRSCSPWYFGPARIARIEDSLEDIASYIMIGSKFVRTLVMNDLSASAFQLDFCIAFRKVHQVQIVSCARDSDDCSDSESDDDEDDEKEFAMDHIGDVRRRLHENKLPYYAFEVKRDLDIRDLSTAFNIFKGRMHKKDIYYPQRSRFCMFLDRRKSNKNGSDKITIFDPQSCSNIPRNHVPEWYFNASKTSIIPGVDSQTAITSDSQLFGQLMTISFHVQASDRMQVYLYWMGRYTRLYPEDLPNIMKNIFDMKSYNNAKWDTGKQADAVKQMKFNDVAFESFYKQASYISV